LKQLSAKEMLVKKMDMIPLEVIVRNVAVGTLVKRFGIEEGRELECPVIEYYLKNEKHDEAMINKDHIVSFGYASSQELKEVHRLASKINVVLIAFFRRRNLKLVDLRLEFGRYNDRIVLGEGIDLDTCRFIDLETDKKWYRDQISMNTVNLEKIYEEFNRRFL
jgi:phosphoribosylaminoimidazole-succinocarboxamide synthase